MTHLTLKTYGAEMELHEHDHHQIVLPRRGRLEMEIDGRGGAVQMGQGAFVAASERHAFKAVCDNRFVVLDVVAETWDPLAEKFLRQPFFAVTPAICHLLDYAESLHLQAAEPAVSEAWAALLLRAFSDQREETEWDEDAGLPALSRALGFMRRHLHQRISVADIGRAAGISESRLYALFRVRFGVSPHARLAQLRLDAACRLLTQSGFSIAEIAARTGHGDQSALTRQMRAQRHVTPAAYRRAARRSSLTP